MIDQSDKGWTTPTEIAQMLGVSTSAVAKAAADERTLCGYCIERRAIPNAWVTGATRYDYRVVTPWKTASRLADEIGSHHMSIINAGRHGCSPRMQSSERAEGVWVESRLLASGKKMHRLIGRAPVAARMHLAGEQPGLQVVVWPDSVEVVERPSWRSVACWWYRGLTAAHTKSQALDLARAELERMQGQRRAA